MRYNISSGVKDAKYYQCNDATNMKPWVVEFLRYGQDEVWQHYGNFRSAATARKIAAMLRNGELE